MFRRGAFGPVTVVRGRGKDRLTRKNVRSGLESIVIRDDEVLRGDESAMVKGLFFCS